MTKNNCPTQQFIVQEGIEACVRRIQKEYPEFATSDSPTQKVGSDLNTKKGKTEGAQKEFVQFPHKYPMLSLGNTYDISEVQAFVERVSKGTGSRFTYSCELKFDGTAICLTYRNGKLFRALNDSVGVWFVQE